MLLSLSDHTCIQSVFISKNSSQDNNSTGSPTSRCVLDVIYVINVGKRLWGRLQIETSIVDPLFHCLRDHKFFFNHSAFPDKVHGRCYQNDIDDHWKHTPLLLVISLDEVIGTRFGAKHSLSIDVIAGQAVPIIIHMPPCLRLLRKRSPFGLHCAEGWRMLMLGWWRLICWSANKTTCALGAWLEKVKHVQKVVCMCVTEGRQEHVDVLLHSWLASLSHHIWHVIWMTKTYDGHAEGNLMLKATEENVHHPYTRWEFRLWGRETSTRTACTYPRSAPIFPSCFFSMEKCHPAGHNWGTLDLQTSPGPRPTTHHQTPFILHGCHQLLTAKTRSSMSIWLFPKKRGTPKSSILIGFSIINHPFWGTTIFGNTHIAGLLPYLAMSFRRKPGKTELLRGFSTTFHLHLACFSWRIPDTTHPGPSQAVKKSSVKNHLGK